MKVGRRGRERVRLHQAKKVRRRPKGFARDCGESGDSLLAVKFPALLFLAASLLSAGSLSAQDITATVAPNLGGSDNSVDIPNPSGGHLHFFSDPTPAAACMARVSGLSAYVWPTVPNFAPDLESHVQNRLSSTESLRVYPKTLPSGSVITIPFRYGPGPTPSNNFIITVVAGAQVTQIVPLDPSPTTATSVRWRVTFDQPVAGVTAANFAFSNPSFTTAAVSGVVPTGASPSATWTVTANVPNGLGDLGLNWVGHRTEAPSVPNSFTGQIYQFALAPFFTQQPASQAIRRNALVTLSATAIMRDDPRPVYYQWYQGTRDNLNPPPISGATSSSYSPPFFTQTGEFRYFCRAYVVNGYSYTDSQDAVISVYDPPQITQSPSGGLFPAGYSLTLSVTATGPNLTYQWYRGNAPDVTQPVVGATGATLPLGPLAQNASYWVRVRNSSPFVDDSGTATVRVVTTFEPIPATLSVPINSAFPRPNLLTVRDSAGVAVGNFPASFTVQAGAGGAAGQFQFGQQSNVGVADANGVLIGPVLTANGVAGVWQLKAENGPVSTTFTCVNLPAFNAATVAGLTTNAGAAPFSLATATGAQSPGGTFSGPGVTGGNTFNPASANLGSNVLTYSVNGASATFTMTVFEARRLVVDLASDTANPLDNATSLREAVAYAQSLGGAQTITFAPALAGQAITLTEAWVAGSQNALEVGGTLTLDGGGGAPVTVNLNAPGQSRRLIWVPGGGFLTTRNLVLSGGDTRATNWWGGAIYIQGRLDLVRTRVTNNSGPAGGAISNDGTLNATESIFDHNTASSEGSAVINNGTFNVASCTFSNNAAFNGAAINSGNGLTVNGSRFTANAASFNGGALRVFGATVIGGSTFDGNSAANDGGAIMSHGGTTLTNCTVANNTSLGCAGVQCWEGTAVLRYVTVALNTAPSGTGGLAVNTADVTATNVLVAGNTAPCVPLPSSASVRSELQNCRCVETEDGSGAQSLPG